MYEIQPVLFDVVYPAGLIKDSGLNPSSVLIMYEFLMS